MFAVFVRPQGKEETTKSHEDEPIVFKIFFCWSPFALRSFACYDLEYYNIGLHYLTPNLTSNISFWAAKNQGL